MTNKKFFFTLFIFFSVITCIHSQDVNNTETENQNIEETMKIDDAGVQPAAVDNPEQKGLVSFTIWDFVRMLLVLFFVILCIYGVFFLLRKAGTGKFTESDLINIISSKSVAVNKSLHIVEVGNQLMLIGVSDDSINLISEITDKETFDTIKLYKGENIPPKGGSFFSYLTGILNSANRDKVKRNKNISEISSGFMERHKKRIEKL